MQKHTKAQNDYKHINSRGRSKTDGGGGERCGVWE